MTSGRLAGIRVIDLTMFLPGPMLGVMLADQGATVIKVEPPAGDPARSEGPFAPSGHGLWFAGLNRGKQAVTLDLKSEAGKAALRDLIATADVLLEGFRPGVLARLGFGWEAARALNPRLVYCSISAFGQAGPLADHPAHDLAVQAMAGFLSVNDNGDGNPVVPGVAASDMAAGLTGLAAVLMALIARERTGVGEYLDISMFDSLLPWCAHTGSAALAGPAPASATHRSLGGSAFYNVYACADGRHIVLAGREAKFAQNLLTALGRPDLIPLAAAPPGPAQAPLVEYLRATFLTRSRDDWAAWFEGRDIAFAPVLDFAEAFAHPQVAARGRVLATPDGPQIAPAIPPAVADWQPGPVPHQDGDVPA